MQLVKNSSKNKSYFLGVCFLLSLVLGLLNPAKARNTQTLSFEKEYTTFQHKADDLDPKILRMGLIAYHRALEQGLVHKPYLTLIDYSKVSDEKRLWVLDLKRLAISYHTYVAHGQNSGDRKAKYFSNTVGSKTSSLGVFVTRNTYIGKRGLSLRINGLEQGVNDNALSRAIVIHGANYVNAAHTGRSWGCPAVPTNLARPLINTIKNGSVIFAYYPKRSYLRHSTYLA